jgi:peptide/nickel transport system ATP-binding protein
MMDKSSEELVLEIDSLDFSYRGKTLLYEDFSLKVRRGELVSIVGRSGSGKTTLFELISDHLEPQKGRIRCGRLAWVFQDPYSSFHPSYTILEQIGDVTSIHGIGDLAMEIGIEQELLGKLPHELSGGQLQRCSILRALLMKPDLILCDEPTSALDNIIQLDVMTLMLKFLDRVGILLITHDMDLARWASDRIVSIDQEKSISDAI